MDQHPVPQNISSYEFRLVGDMTLKQFFQLAGGIAVGLLFYRSPFPFFIKYPFAFISVLGGILLAFVPLQGRPFSQWIMAFIKAVYSPTEFFWHPDPVAVTAPPTAPEVEAQPIKPEVTNPLDQLETQMVSKFTELFNSVTHHSVPPISTPPVIERSVPPPSPTPAPLPQTPLPEPKMSTPFYASNRQFLEAVGLTPAARYTPLTGSEYITNSLSVFTPTQPNILAGIVVDGSGQIIEGAILEIAEKASGLPVRALRSNKLGQFQIATPLPNGEYVITTDKDGFLFDPLVIVTSGQIIQPIEIKAKAVS